ncbi:hypothetical protein [Enterovibrio norvegicus]|uniref:hypothetical protein n=1 Tax=Enterovibrio norvegicus TaxID=188144 RepID=UPI00352BD743
MANAKVLDRQIARESQAAQLMRFQCSKSLMIDLFGNLPTNAKNYNRESTTRKCSTHACAFLDDCQELQIFAAQLLNCYITITGDITCERRFDLNQLIRTYSAFLFFQPPSEIAETIMKFDFNRFWSLLNGVQTRKLVIRNCKCGVTFVHRNHKRTDSCPHCS